MSVEGSGPGGNGNISLGRGIASPAACPATGERILQALLERDSRICPIQASGEIRQARLEAAELVASIGFGEGEELAVALIVGELGTNLIRHAGGGQLLFRRLQDGDRAGLEILSIDQGPGMEDVARCLRDGYSTGGTLGTGLGVVRRLSDEFDLYSQVGRGTVLMSRVWRDGDGADGGWRLGLVRTTPQGSAPRLRGRVLVQPRPLQGAPGKGGGPFRALMPTSSRPDLVPSRQGVRATTSSEVAAKREFSSPSWQAVLVLDDGFVPGTWDSKEYPHLLERHPALLAATLFRDHAPPGRPVTVAAVAGRPLAATSDRPLVAPGGLLAGTCEAS